MIRSVSPTSCSMSGMATPNSYCYPPMGLVSGDLSIIDVATRRKLPMLLQALHEAESDRRSRALQVKCACSSQPTHTTITSAGWQICSNRYPDDGFIEEFWEPGYFYLGPIFSQSDAAARESSGYAVAATDLGHSQFLDTVRITVMGPGVGLKTRFDTYGVNVNDASITMMIEYPATKVQAEADPHRPTDESTAGWSGGRPADSSSEPTLSSPHGHKQRSISPIWSRSTTRCSRANSGRPPAAITSEPT